MTKKLYIIRHCSAVGQGQDAPLTREGEGQAERLAEFLLDSKIEWIVSSPYVRARLSIEPLVKRLNVGMQIDARLSERVLSTGHLDNWLC
ncbi:histidine phosphatase family protein, partial [Alicyclobacillus shizuokensis]|uniref:histidine phosphatase family protein n=1 Tax=Alicyclobacillus shizuokensis TaxID=392014 RepID=UPI000B141E67